MPPSTVRFAPVSSTVLKLFLSRLDELVGPNQKH
jgi:hypothetical protein